MLVFAADAFAPYLALPGQHVESTGSGLGVAQRGEYVSRRAGATHVQMVLGALLNGCCGAGACGSAGRSVSGRHTPRARPLISAVEIMTAGLAVGLKAPTVSTAQPPARSRHNAGKAASGSGRGGQSATTTATATTALADKDVMGGHRHRRVEVIEGSGHHRAMPTLMVIGMCLPAKSEAVAFDLQPLAQLQHAQCIRASTQNSSPRTTATANHPVRSVLHRPRDLGKPVVAGPLPCI